MRYIDTELTEEDRKIIQVAGEVLGTANEEETLKKLLQMGLDDRSRRRRKRIFPVNVIPFTWFRK